MPTLTAQTPGALKSREVNPKIIHRIYFTNFAPFHDPYEHYLETWRREMPDYRIMQWNMSNLDVHANEWTKKAFGDKAPVFLSEYFRWKILHDFGGLYLDADCEILNGRVLHGIIDELYSQDDYEVFFGVEEQENGHPTAQTCGAKKGAALPKFMMQMYENHLGALWPWREKRGLIGPQLMGLYFLDKGINTQTDGFFTNLTRPVIAGGAKVYPQTYFSPKFSLLGEDLNFDPDKTCVYHLFANSNIDFSKNKKESKTRAQALTFQEYRTELKKRQQFPRTYDASHLSTQVGTQTETSIAAANATGVVLYGPYISLPPGKYTATVRCDKLPTRGQAAFNVTSELGQKSLGSAAFSFAGGAARTIACKFEVVEKAAVNTEFVLSVTDIDEISVASVELDRLDGTRRKGGGLKILHRVYFGFDGKPDQFTKYLETWKEQLPEFEIKHWNTSNLPMEINDYVIKLHKEKDHAFLTDFFRWYLLHKYGGIYLDADVEIVNGDLFRTLVEELETSTLFDAFIGIDERRGGWYTAHSMASKPGSELSRFMCELYTNFGSFAAWRKKGMYFWAPQLVALYFANIGHNVAGMGTTPKLDAPTVIGRVKIYPQDWFSPLSPTGDASVPFELNGYSENTSICHHFACSWHDADSIYLEHSKKAGGQANVFLRDVVARSKQMRFAASSDRVKTLVGKKDGGTLKTQATAGFLAYGPYASLSAGTFTVSFVLKNVVSLKGASFDVASDFGGNVLAQIMPVAADLKEDTISLRWSLSSPVESVEFRVSVGSEANFELVEIGLVKNS